MKARKRNRKTKARVQRKDEKYMARQVMNDYYEVQSALEDSNDSNN